MERRGTVARLLENYNSCTDRPTPYSDPSTTRTIFAFYRRTLSPHLPSSKTAKILDIGCGEGLTLAFLKQEGYTHLTGLDASPENVRICRNFGFDNVHCHDALELETFRKGDEYDLILAMDLLEHLPKESAADFLVSVRSRLRANALLVIQTPNLGCVYGAFHRYSDLSHYFGLTERSASSLMKLAGFSPSAVSILPSWNATTILGRLRELYLCLLHRFIYLAEDSSRPQIPTKNLLITAAKT
jgi:SAM-dependent methyltransferase